MPRQNRVTPDGEIMAVPERGTLMGNRGCLHDAGRTIRRPWQVRRWIACQTAFKDRRRQLMTPGHYTELFFLDEATSLAAGHRPCAECRRDRFNAFRTAWAAAAGTGSHLPTDGEMDDRLHSERVGQDGSKRCFSAKLADLPDGVMVRHDAWGDTAHLVIGDQLLTWSAGGYAERITRPDEFGVAVLTPESTVRAIRAGYTPGLHPTAAAWVRSGVAAARPHTRRDEMGTKGSPRPSADGRRDVTRLEDVPNVGPAVAADLRLLGIDSPTELIGRDPYAMYDDLCRVTGVRHDPCVLDTFLAAVRFMEGGPKQPWWAFTAERKRELADRAAGR